LPVGCEPDGVINERLPSTEAAASVPAHRKAATSGIEGWRQRSRKAKGKKWKFKRSNS
jgi:hypothetical protein